MGSLAKSSTSCPSNSQAVGKTPKSEGIKGDKFVGDYYILFDKIHNEQKNELLNSGIEKDKAEESTQIMQDAKNELMNWEKNDEETLKI